MDPIRAMRSLALRLMTCPSERSEQYLAALALDLRHAQDRVLRWLTHHKSITECLGPDEYRAGLFIHQKLCALSQQLWDEANSKT